MLLNILTNSFGLLSIICIAGVIYPFKPFKSRKKAVLGFVVTFFAFTVFSMSIMSSPEYKAEQDKLATESLRIANAALDTRNYDKAEAALADVREFVSEVKKLEVAQLRAAIAKERDLPIIKGIISNDELDVQVKLEKIKSLWDGLQDNKDGLIALSFELEPLVLELVKPIPTSNLKENRFGYELLADIDTYTNERDPSYAVKARSYARKIDGCSRPDYDFLLQVPKRLNDPRSFKPGPVYWGPYNNNQTTRTVYLDYRAKNGFGGVISNTATGLVTLSTCSFTIVTLQ